MENELKLPQALKDCAPFFDWSTGKVPLLLKTTDVHRVINELESRATQPADTKGAAANTSALDAALHVYRVANYACDQTGRENASTGRRQDAAIALVEASDAIYALFAACDRQPEREPVGVLWIGQERNYAFTFLPSAHSLPKGNNPLYALPPLPEPKNSE